MAWVVWPLAVFRRRVVFGETALVVVVAIADAVVMMLVAARIPHVHKGMRARITWTQRVQCLAPDGYESVDQDEQN